MFAKWQIGIALALLLSGPASAAEEPGISPTEIKIGGVFPFSGPASSIGLVGRGLMAYIQSLNDRGGINGRRINYIAYDDAYSPPKAVEQVRKLISASYEITEPTVDSQITNLRSSGAEALIVAGTPKFAAQAIRQASVIGWKATVIINFPSGSVGGTLAPAGLDKSVGVIVGTINKDILDGSWKDDPAMHAYRAFLDKYLPGVDITNGSYLTGYQQGILLEQILKQCGNDLSRKNILAQAKNLKDVIVPTALPGIKVNTSETENMIWTQMRLQRWTGTTWQAFGEVLDARSE